MNNAVRVVITEEEILNDLNIKPENAVITSAKFNAERGVIEVFIRTSDSGIGTFDFQGQRW